MADSHHPERFNRNLCRAVCEQTYLGGLRGRAVRRACQAYRHASRWADPDTPAPTATTSLLHLSLAGGKFPINQEVWCAAAIGGPRLFYHDAPEDVSFVVPSPDSKRAAHQPDLIRSDCDRVPWCSGPWPTEFGAIRLDVDFLLATNTMADFLLQRQHVVPAICSMIAHEKFGRLEKWLLSNIQQGNLADDDITLMLVRVPRHPRGRGADRIVHHRAGKDMLRQARLMWLLRELRVGDTQPPLCLPKPGEVWPEPIIAAVKPFFAKRQLSQWFAKRWCQRVPRD
jgi:hypothetical protein